MISPTEKGRLLSYFISREWIRFGAALVRLAASRRQRARKKIGPSPVPAISIEDQCASRTRLVVV
jgi:hypothetical protein